MSDSTTNESLQVFVYGTLLPHEVNHDRFLAGRTSNEVPATLVGARMWANGDRFALPGRSWPFPFVALDADLRLTVTGCHITIPAEHATEVLRDLDELETFVPGAAHNRYERIQVRVQTATGHAQCWTYVASERIRSELDDLPPIPHGDWLRYLRDE